MNAEFEGLNGGVTPMISPSASHNVTIRFTFDENAGGQVPLKVIATSTNNGDVEGEGEIVFPVGSQGWLRLTATEDLVIDSAGTYETVLTLRNQDNEMQTVTIDVEQGSSSTWYRASSDSESAPLTIQEGRERMITVKVVITETSLLNLNDDELVTSFEVWARSNTRSDSTNATIKVTLISSSSDGKGSTDAASEDASSGGSVIMDIGIWAVAIAIIGFLLVFLVRVMFEDEEEESSPWDTEEYESSIAAQYGAVPAAPEVPAAPDISSFAPPASTPPVVEPAAPAVADGVPPLPASGLPEGWTMEQWTHYGAEWLKKNS